MPMLLSLALCNSAFLPLTSNEEYAHDMMKELPKIIISRKSFLYQSERPANDRRWMLIVIDQATRLRRPRCTLSPRIAFGDELPRISPAMPIIIENRRQ